MRVIGIDPGIERTGFAILEKNTKSREVSLLDYGCIMTDRALPFGNRLTCLADDLRLILRQWKPVAAGLEQIFFSKNVKTAMKVAHARGVIMETLEEHGVHIEEFNPAHVKMAVSGDSKADKLQIKKMLKCLLNLELKSDDAADAIACGICLITNK